MAKKYFIIINLLFIIAIPIWWFSLAAVMNFDIGFKFGPHDDLELGNVYSNLIFFGSAGVVLIIIGIHLLSKYNKNKKDSALILGTYNLILGCAACYESIRKFIDFTRKFDTAREDLTFVLMSWAVIFFFLFLQEILRGNFKFENHRVTHTSFIIIMVTVNFFVMLWPFYYEFEVIKYIGVATLGITVVVLSIWQIRSALRLRKKSSEKVVKQGLAMIALSGVFYIVAVITLALIEVDPIFDMIVPMVILVLAIVTYMGYVFPSKKRT
ncbi:MAG: hypothetical protein ACFFCS_20955 [Candidatus Hodarchaeota archaeon]